MGCIVRLMIRKTAFRLVLALAFFLVFAWSRIALCETVADDSSNRPSAVPAEQFRRFIVEFEPDAYYSDIDLTIALTKIPIPHIGEQTEAEIYRTLLSRAALLPQFLVLEVSVNPMPYFGTYIKREDRDFYDNAQLSRSFNWVKALTAGFEEPYAASVLAGNVVDFDIPGSTDIKGNGYSGYLFSAGNYHIKDNELVQDKWYEFEWKMKGDRKSSVKKLSWSFRIGAKLHGNPDITDIIYLSFRRSRLNYQSEGASLFNNSGFEYTFDMDRKTFQSVRHYFYVDKKWPLESKKMAFSLAAGFVWESAHKYTGALATGRTSSDFQIILRPNLEF